MLNELQQILGGYEMRPITKENHLDVWSIYETNQDFFMLTGARKQPRQE